MNRGPWNRGNLMIPCLEKAKWCHGSWSSHNVNSLWLPFGWCGPVGRGRIAIVIACYSCFKLFPSFVSLFSLHKFLFRHVDYKCCLCKSCHLFRRVFLLHRTSIRFECPNAHSPTGQKIVIPVFQVFSLKFEAHAHLHGQSCHRLLINGCNSSTWAASHLQTSLRRVFPPWRDWVGNEQKHFVDEISESIAIQR